MSICVPVITPGHCGSSLLLQILEDLECYAPAGDKVDDRHPCGYHDEMRLLQPQIDGDWGAYAAAVEGHKRHLLWAFKLQGGISHWGRDALDVLPDPRIIVYDQEDLESVRARIGPGSTVQGRHWLDRFYEALGPALAGRPYLRLTFEQLKEDPEACVSKIWWMTGGHGDWRKAVGRVLP